MGEVVDLRKSGEPIDIDNSVVEEKLDIIITNTNNNATETTLSGVKTQTDKLTFADGKLQVDAEITIPTGLATDLVLSEVLLFNKRIETILVSLLNEQKLTNKILKKIYNPQ